METGDSSPAGVQNEVTWLVNWDEAENMRLELAKRGFPATLCLDPKARTARLEPWPGVDPVAAAVALTELRQASVG